ncbi:MAG TPA: polysaccharide deacetylase family protein [Thermodesulfobacteriota bacterium]|nr:polysaccharide deacetylase family protein [Thermodesulfobacteriota bacterium]
MNPWGHAKVPVLLYHALFEGRPHVEKYAIATDTFERHIHYLLEEGFETVSFRAFSDGFQPRPGKKYVLLTFDDGNYSDYSIAFRLLKKYGLVATFFVTVGRIGTPDHLDWDHLKEMIDGDMSVQSHSLNHLFLSDLSKDSLRTELTESKRILEDKLSSPIHFISLPGGFYSRRVLKAAQSAGYQGVATSAPGLNILGRSEGAFRLYNRFAITRRTRMDRFEEIAQAHLLSNAKSQAVYRVKSIAQKVLGSKGYYTIWSKWFKYEKEYEKSHAE